MDLEGKIRQRFGFVKKPQQVVVLWLIVIFTTICSFDKMATCVKILKDKQKS